MELFSSSMEQAYFLEKMYSRQNFLSFYPLLLLLNIRSHKKIYIFLFISTIGSHICVVQASNNLCFLTNCIMFIVEYKLRSPKFITKKQVDLNNGLSILSRKENLERKNMQHPPSQITAFKNIVVLNSVEPWSWRWIFFQPLCCSEYLSSLNIRTKLFHSKLCQK